MVVQLPVRHISDANRGLKKGEIDWNYFRTTFALYPNICRLFRLSLSLTARLLGFLRELFMFLVCDYCRLFRLSLSLTAR